MILWWINSAITFYVEYILYKLDDNIMWKVSAKILIIKYIGNENFYQFLSHYICSLVFVIPLCPTTLTYWLFALWTSHRWLSTFHFLLSCTQVFITLMLPVTHTTILWFNDIAIIFLQLHPIRCTFFCPHPITTGILNYNLTFFPAFGFNSICQTTQAEEAHFAIAWYKIRLSHPPRSGVFSIPVHWDGVIQ